MPAGEALETRGFFHRQPEVAQLNLAVGTGERQGACDGTAIVILVDQLPRRLFAVGERGRERQPRGAAGRNAQRLPQADDRIEHRSGGV